MKDSLGDRMKDFYENKTRYFLPRRTYTIIRVDGKAFHTYTRGLKSPFDDDFMRNMDETAAFLCKNIMGAKFAFVQSDEISLLLTDFDDVGTQAWFDGNLQKMASVAASMTTVRFNELRPGKPAMFDARVFQIPQKTEVENYFIWRQQDFTRNSIATVARSLYSSKQLMNKNSDELQELIFQKGINWNDYAARYKRGRMTIKEQYEKDGTLRSRWISTEVPVFTQERNFLSEKIPDNN